MGPPAAKKNAWGPSIKMRQLHWEKVPDNSIKATIWATRQIDVDFYKKMLDFSEFEQVFAAKAKAEVGNNEVKVDKKKVDKISVIDSKRAYNLSIMLGMIKMTFFEIKEAILSVDDEKLEDNMLVQFLNYVPTAEETKALEPFKGEPEKLAASDAFMLELSSISRLENRLRSMVFRRQFAEKLKEIRPPIDTVSKAARALKTSNNFFRVLEIVLVLGNFMNSDTAKGNAAGIKISSIIKLPDTKSANNQMTLMNFVANVVENKFAEVLLFKDELESCEEASKVSAQALQADINELRNGLKFVENELQHHKDSAKDHFHSKMIEFLAGAKKEMEEVDRKYKRMEDSFQEVVQLFGEDPTKMGPEEFFKIVSTFCSLFTSALEENHQRVAAALAREKRQQALEEKERRKREREEMRKAAPDISAASEDQKGVLDDMISALKGGNAFQGKRERRRGRDTADDAVEVDANNLLAKLLSDE